MRTIRRDIRACGDKGIHVPMRGQQEDIGPTVGHRELALRYWLAGDEPVWRGILRSEGRRKRRTLALREVQSRLKESMKTTLSHANVIYAPGKFKTFAGTLGAFFEQECPQIGGARTRQIRVQHVQSMVEQFDP
ncbi:MAG: DUF1670 domain-containing protein [Lentisphaerae bacterium]|nr:DUF1670 domain-containing protein [Lentisphaerota bacterium]